MLQINIVNLFYVFFSAFLIYSLLSSWESRKSYDRLGLFGATFILF